jgi:Xaa-Pro aminopeptidase
MSKVEDFPRIPDSEFVERISNVKKKMAEQSLDLLVIYSNMLDPGHVRYLSDVFGINESAAMVIPLAGDPIVCSGQACQAWSEHKSRVKDVRIFPEVGETAGTEYMVGEQFGFTGFFKELSGQYNIKKIGTVGTLIFPQIIYAQLQNVFPNVEIVNAESLMIDLRFVKSKNEIACMRKAAEILDATFAEVIPRIETGWTELDIQAEITSGILKRGAESTAAAWEPMIPSGPEHSKLCMNRNSRRKVKEGEIICLQVGALYEGHNAALNSPVVLGSVPDEIKKAVNCAYDATEAIAATLKAGVSSKEVNEVGKAVLAKKGYDKYSPYAMVHNIGLCECESPWMAEDKEFIIPENATVCIDTFLFRMDWGSFRIEDTIAITATGADCLTRFNETYIRKHFA